MRQAETAITVYHQDIEPSLARRQGFVRRELQAFRAVTGAWPTALELLRFTVVRHAGTTYDVNTVRPRLTELWQQGWIVREDKRTCRVSGKTVFVWELKERPLGLF